MQAMILAAGRGERLKSLTKNTPKPLLKIKNKELIVYHIEKLAKANIKKIVINTFYLGKKIENFLKTGKQFGVDITYSREEKLLETGGAIKKALYFFQKKDFILVNADIYTNFDFSKLKSIDLKNNLAYLVLAKKNTNNADFTLTQEKVLLTKNNDLTYTGIAKFNSKIFEKYMPLKNRFPLLETFKMAIKKNALQGEIYKGFWQDAGTIDSFNSLQN